MSFKDMTFDLTPEQIAARNKLGEQLLALPEIQLFMEKYDAPEALIIENASKFKRWVSAKRKANTFSKDEIREDHQKGRFVDLSFDKHTGIIKETMRELSVLKEVEAEVAYLSRYAIFDLPLNLQGALFANLNYEQENDNFKMLAAKLMKFTQDASNGYFIYGDLGIGKSYLSACVTNALAMEGKSVAYVHVPSLLNYLKQQFNSGGLDFAVRRLSQVHTLVLDDLGAEPVTAWSRDEILLTILNDRLENRRKTLITSNYKPDMLIDMYKLDARGTSDEIRARRLVDRILALTNPYEMVGKNRRKR